MVTWGLAFFPASHVPTLLLMPPPGPGPPVTPVTPGPPGRAVLTRRIEPSLRGAMMSISFEPMPTDTLFDPPSTGVGQGSDRGRTGVGQGLGCLDVRGRRVFPGGAIRNTQRAPEGAAPNNLPLRAGKGGKGGVGVPGSSALRALPGGPTRTCREGGREVGAPGWRSRPASRRRSGLGHVPTQGLLKEGSGAHCVVWGVLVRGMGSWSAWHGDFECVVGGRETGRGQRERVEGARERGERGRP